MPSLTRIEATERTELLSTRSYHVELDLTQPDTFRSTTTIAFDAARSNSDTFLDIKPGVLHSVTLNGRELDVASLHEGRFPLPGLAERNEVVVVAEMDYSKESEGLHRQLDPADGQVRFLYPRYAAWPATLEHAEKLLAREDLSLPLRRRVVDFNDDLRRVIRARAASGG